MQETKVLYTAKEGNHATNGFRIPRLVDVLMFLGVIFMIAGVLGRAIASGDPGALWFVKVAVGVMLISIGVLGLMLLVNGVGLWGLLGLVPLGLFGFLWLTGVSGQTLLHQLGQGMMHGITQVLKVGFYGFVGVGGLGLLARLLEKVGVWGFIFTISLATCVSIWIIP
jgi:hypothetical protein